MIMIDVIVLRKLAANFPKHGEPAVAGIKNANGCGRYHGKGLFRDNMRGAIQRAAPKIRHRPRLFYSPKIDLPKYVAASPSSSSMRSNWLYLATLSERLAEPVLIWPVLSATARSAMVVSSVSPERWLMIDV